MNNKDFCKEMLLQEQAKRAAGNESTADLYRAVRNHLRCFCREGKLLMKDVTPEWVHCFWEWLRKKGLRTNSVNSYMSNFRAMYNRACGGGNHQTKGSPFAGLLLKREETRKRAVPIQVIGQIACMDFRKEPEKQLAVDMALLSFMACGIPFVDIAHLTKDNLVDKGNILWYRRQKTGALIELEVTTGIQFLIDRYSRPDTRYLFPILSADTTHEQYKHCLAKENSYLKEIAVDLKLTEPLTTYVFRHAWASEAYHQHVPIGIISQALGHSTEKMTRTYLSAFGTDEVAKANKQVSGSIELLLRR